MSHRHRAAHSMNTCGTKIMQWHSAYFFNFYFNVYFVLRVSILDKIFTIPSWTWEKCGIRVAMQVFDLYLCWCICFCNAMAWNDSREIQFIVLFHLMVLFQLLILYPILQHNQLIVQYYHYHKNKCTEASQFICRWVLELKIHPKLGFGEPLCCWPCELTIPLGWASRWGRSGWSAPHFRQNILLF